MSLRKESKREAQKAARQAAQPVPVVKPKPKSKPKSKSLVGFKPSPPVKVEFSKKTRFPNRKREIVETELMKG